MTEIQRKTNKLNIELNIEFDMQKKILSASNLYGRNELLNKSIANKLADKLLSLHNDGSISNPKVNNWLEKLGIVGGAPAPVGSNRSMNDDVRQVVANHLFDILDMEPTLANPYAYSGMSNVNSQSVLFTIHPSYILTLLSSAPLPGKSSNTPASYNADANGDILAVGTPGLAQPRVTMTHATTTANPLLGIIFQIKAVNTMSGISQFQVTLNSMILDLQLDDINSPGVGMFLNPGRSNTRNVSVTNVIAAPTLDSTFVSTDSAIQNEWNWNPARAFAKTDDFFAAVNANINLWPVFNTIGVFEAVLASIVSDNMPSIADNMMMAAAADLGLIVPSK